MRPGLPDSLANWTAVGLKTSRGPFTQTIAFLALGQEFRGSHEMGSRVGILRLVRDFDNVAIAEPDVRSGFVVAAIHNEFALLAGGQVGANEFDVG